MVDADKHYQSHVVCNVYYNHRRSTERRGDRCDLCITSTLCFHAFKSIMSSSYVYQDLCYVNNSTSTMPLHRIQINPISSHIAKCTKTTVYLDAATLQRQNL
jgi:hypothetical protein